MTSLFTPDEMPRVAKTLKTLETTIDTVVCAGKSQHVRNHSWDRLDNRKRVKQALRAAKHQADSMLRLMERTDLERLAHE
jgi:hypothetical protein